MRGDAPVQAGAPGDDALAPGDEVAVAVRAAFEVGAGTRTGDERGDPLRDLGSLGALELALSTGRVPQDDLRHEPTRLRLAVDNDGDAVDDELRVGVGSALVDGDRRRVVEADDDSLAHEASPTLASFSRRTSTSTRA